MPVISPERLECLEELNKKVLWLSSWIIHYANNLRSKGDDLKVGGHQASCASATAIMSALFLEIIHPEDRVAVKPHASPVFHAIQYLLGNQSLNAIKKFRAFGGAQAYPSRTKDFADVDFSTGSVGLGVSLTLFASMVQNYVITRAFSNQKKKPSRMIAILGDAELDEGNIYEALLEGWKHDVRNLWWIVDYNRQSLDGVINDFLFQKIKSFFETVGWNVVNLKYGKLQESVFLGPAGKVLREWIDSCPNDLYSALTFKGGLSWRNRLQKDLGGASGLDEFLENTSDQLLHKIMTNLGGHDLETLVEAFRKAQQDDTPTCFVAYTIKGYGLPIAGHKDNHAGIMTGDQINLFKNNNGIRDGEEWALFSGAKIDEDRLTEYLKGVSFASRSKTTKKIPEIQIESKKMEFDKKVSTQNTFGMMMRQIGRDNTEFSNRIITTSPDVTVSTNLSGWVNSRGLFKNVKHSDVFIEEKVSSPIRWDKSPHGQHIELGIAENNLFLLLAAMGLSKQLFGERLLPLGTIYDTFISRGLDALNYACYQDSRFILVGTPSGISLAPEGGAHQSIATPLIGISQDGLAAFEPAYADELEVILNWSFDYIQRDGSGNSKIEWLRDKEGGAVYIRLSTRPIDQPERILSEEVKTNIIAGGYWLRQPKDKAELAIIFTGSLAPEALEAWQRIIINFPGTGVLCVTSADRLNAGWHAAQKARQEGEVNVNAHVERLLAPLARQAVLVTVLDGHPATLSWLGGVRGQKTESLGVEHFGQSGDIKSLFNAYRIDSSSIYNACLAACRSHAVIREKND